MLYVDIAYEVRGLNDPRNLVFPFYVIPSHDEPANSLPAAIPAAALAAAAFNAPTTRPVLLGGTS